MPKATRTNGCRPRFGAPNFASSTGEGIISGTKQEYEDEYVIGFEQNSRSRWFSRPATPTAASAASSRTSARSRLKASTIVPNYNGGITNPGPSTDIAVNEQEVTYTPAQFNAANAAALPARWTHGANYNAPVTGCTYANDTYLRAGGFFVNGLQQAGRRRLLPEPFDG